KSLRAPDNRTLIGARGFQPSVVSTPPFNQNVNSALIRNNRPVRTAPAPAKDRGWSQGPLGTNALLYVRIGLAFSALYMSSATMARLPENLRSLATRKSSWLMRSPYKLPGSIRLTVTKAPFPDGSRPSDCAPVAAGTS